MTINGVHLNELGNKKIGEVIAQALLKKQIGATTAHEKLREAVLDKNWHWHNRYRATDGNDVWGGRSNLRFVDDQSNAEVLQHELVMLDVMTANRDKLVWATAQGKKHKVDDSSVPKRRSRLFRASGVEAGARMRARKVRPLTSAPKRAENAWRFAKVSKSISSPTRFNSRN